MAKTIIRNAARLEALEAELDKLSRAIDNEENVPERFDSSLRADLAAADAAVLTRAGEVVARLKRWSRYNVNAERRYTRDLSSESSSSRPGPRLLG